MTWQVYEAGGTYLAGTPLHGPPGTSLSPCCLVVITPVIHPASSCSQAWGRCWVVCRGWGVLRLFFAFWGSWCSLVSFLVLVPVSSSLPVSVAGPIAVGAGAIVISPSRLPSKLHPLSTPRAVARGRGAGVGLSFVAVVVPGKEGGELA